MKHLPALASRILFSLLVLSFCSTAFSQGIPPGIDGQRWSGNTAQTQAQNYGQGSPLRLTWGFAADGTFINSFNSGTAANSNLIARLDSIYGISGGGADLTTRSWFAAFQSTFNRWSSISGLSYQYQPNDDGATFQSSNGNSARADIRIGGRTIDGAGGGGGSVLAFNFFPNGGGDMVIDTSPAETFYNNSPNNSLGLRNVLAHEHGHGIGMDHVDPVSFGQPSIQYKLMEPFVSTSYDGPQHHDILVAQRAYGDVNEKSFGQLGNDAFQRATVLGAIGDGASVSIGNSARTNVGFSNAVDFVSIDDTSDTDYFSFAVNQASTADITLESLGLTYNVGPQDGTTGSFNSRTRSDLALALFDTNGTSLIQFANATGLGGNEMLTGINLTSAGTYFVRVTGTNNPDTNINLDTQFYGLSIGITAVAIPEPGSLALLGMGAIAAAFKRRRSV